MKVLNRHSRRFEFRAEEVGACLDSLASKDDLLWPWEHWPPMVLDRVLGRRARGGHGPIRYFVEDFDPGQRVVFRFLAPDGFNGTHAFEVEGSDACCELRHTIDMRVSGLALVTWPLVFRPLHDALLEDSLDKVEAYLGGKEWHRRTWSPWVRFLRSLLARRRKRKKRGAR
jgi:hypothetical protein